MIIEERVGERGLEEKFDSFTNRNDGNLLFLMAYSTNPLGNHKENEEYFLFLITYIIDIYGLYTKVCPTFQKRRVI